MRNLVVLIPLLLLVLLDLNSFHDSVPMMILLYCLFLPVYPSSLLSLHQRRMVYLHPPHHLVQLMILLTDNLISQYLALIMDIVEISFSLSFRSKLLKSQICNALRWNHGRWNINDGEREMRDMNSIRYEYQYHLYTFISWKEYYLTSISCSIRTSSQQYP